MLTRIVCKSLCCTGGAQLLQEVALDDDYREQEKYGTIGTPLLLQAPFLLLLFTSPSIFLSLSFPNHLLSFSFSTSFSLRYDNLADIFAIIRTLQFLETAFTRDTISNADYERECDKLLLNYETVRQACMDSLPPPLSHPFSLGSCASFSLSCASFSFQGARKSCTFLSEESNLPIAVIVTERLWTAIPHTEVRLKLLLITPSPNIFNCRIRHIHSRRQSAIVKISTLTSLCKRTSLRAHRRNTV